MPRCIFCNEWAGPDSDRHERCAAEFDRQMRQAGLIRRLFIRAAQWTRAAFAVVTSSWARPR